MKNRVQRLHKKIWGTIEEARNYLRVDHDAIAGRLVPHSYHREHKEGHIRFRVMGAPRTTKLCWEDVLAIKPSATTRRS